jgi:hypothetical protein
VSLEDEVPVLSDEDMLEGEEHHAHLNHVYSFVTTDTDDASSSANDSDSSFEALYHDVNDDIRDEIYEAVQF